MMYTLNNQVLKKVTFGRINDFFICHFNDFLAPFLFLGFINIVMERNIGRLLKFYECMLLLFVASFFWEFVALEVKKSSVCDLKDILTYFVGGIIYFFIISIKRRYK